ncbi:hypothetical protein [Methylobacter luteus]|uniref:hypothetical protein n=1 Tax=Methylobacter luteus TaxID=415 RepID=UPI00040F3BF9|nr:hypothetical protein [Methylobacter luteus]
MSHIIETLPASHPDHIAAVKQILEQFPEADRESMFAEYMKDSGAKVSKQIVADDDFVFLALNFWTKSRKESIHMLTRWFEYAIRPALILSSLKIVKDDC